MTFNMTDLDIINLEADEDDDSMNWNSLMYPIIGCIVSVLCVIGVVAFIVSQKRCRNRTPKDTESEILKQKHFQEKQNAANTSLLYNDIAGKPVYTSITQQEDNDIAVEVREHYKQISQNANEPIICCPNDKSSYSYDPKSNVFETQQSSGELQHETHHRPHDKEPTSDNEFDNDSLLSHLSEEDELSNGKQICNTIECNKDEKLANKANPSDVVNSDEIVSNWICSEPDQSKARSDSPSNSIAENKSMHKSKNQETLVEHDASMKTNFDMNYGEVDSILTSVSRMDKNRLEKLKDTGFYKGLQYDRNQLNLSLHSVNVESMTETTTTQHSSNHGISNRANNALLDETESINNTFSESDNEEVLAEWQKIAHRQSLRKPSQYVDNNSESFFKTVRPRLNPDDFSESERTFSDDFKKSRKGSEVSGILESTLSANTYNYDKESRFIVIDEPRNNVKQKENRKSSDSEYSSWTRQSTSEHQCKNPKSSLIRSFANSSSDTLADLEDFVDDLSFNNDMSFISFGTKSIITIDSSEPGKSSNTESSNNCRNGNKPNAVVHKRQRIGNTQSQTVTSIGRAVGNGGCVDRTDSSASSTSISSIRTDPNNERTPIRVPTKYKSARGNLSAYISSRQSATANKKHELSRSLSSASSSLSPKLSLSPRSKSRLSPGRKMFQSDGKKIPAKSPHRLNGSF